MKKTLVFAMAMALGISGAAFAANPFSDVPAGHWAYASIAKLAAAGIVDGYPDGSFRGDRTMTRYEMAQIVAKALAKGAIGADDKLVGEFSDELNNLGVRVAKLEKKADNVKITGNIRTHYVDIKRDKNAGVDTYASKIRSRLFFTGQVNDNWNYVGMLQNEQSLINENGDSTTRFQRAFIDGSLGGVKITAGRFGEFLGEGNIYDSRVDGIRATVGEKIKLTAAYGKMSSIDGTFDQPADTTKLNDGSVAGRYWRVGTEGKFGKNFSLTADYLSADKVKAQNGANDSITTVAANYAVNDWNLGAMWLHGNSDYANDNDYSKNGYVITLGLGSAKASKPGTADFWAKYYSQPASTVIAHTMTGDYSQAFGLKGFGVGVDYTLAKNMVAGFQYFNLKHKDGNTDDTRRKTMWSQLIVTF